MMNGESFLVVTPPTNMMQSMNGSISSSSQSSLLQRLTKLIQENDSLKKCLLDNNVMAKRMLNDISKWKNSERHHNHQTVLQLKGRIITLEHQLQSAYQQENKTNGTSGNLSNGTKSEESTTTITLQDSSKDNNNSEEINNLRKINMFLTQTLQKYKTKIEEFENNLPSVEVFQVSSNQQQAEVSSLKETIKKKESEATNLQDEIKELEEQLSSMCERNDDLEMENSSLKSEIKNQGMVSSVPAQISSPDMSIEIVGVEDFANQTLTNSDDTTRNMNNAKVEQTDIRLKEMEICLAEKEVMITEQMVQLKKMSENCENLEKLHQKSLEDQADLRSQMEAKAAVATKMGEMKISHEKEASEALTELYKKLTAKDNEIEGAKMEINSLKEALNHLSQYDKELEVEREKVELLELQMNLYKTDFEAERSARENQNSEIVAMKEQLQEVVKQNDRLKCDLEVLSASDMGRPIQRNNHASMMSNQWQEPVPSLYGHVPYHTGNDQHNLNGRGVPIYDQPAWNIPYSNNNANNDNESETSIPCPKCNGIFPNIDSLQIHMMHCLK